MAQRSLPLDDDHVRMLGLEDLQHGGFDLARAELAWDGVKRNAVARTLDETALVIV